jgi:hypothetical protein
MSTSSLMRLDRIWILMKYDLTFLFGHWIDHIWFCDCLRRMLDLRYCSHVEYDVGHLLRSLVLHGGDRMIEHVCTLRTEAP